MKRIHTSVQRFIASGVLAFVAAVSIGTSAGAVAPPSGSTYVALGDSFSSGAGSGIVPGVPVENQAVYDPLTNTTTNQCLRSSKSYPVKLSTQYSLVLKNVSCAGATTSSLLITGQFGEPAQIGSVTSDTKLVTLTIGGNDIGFVDVVSCIVTSECSASSAAITTSNTQLAALPAKLDTVLNEIKSRAPAAHIAIAGYPQIVPHYGQPALGCRPWLSWNEQRVANDMENTLNATIAAAATRAGATYVDPAAAGSPFLKRDLVGLTTDACSLSAGRQINGIRVDFNAGSFHPNAYGQQSYQTLFSAAL